MRPNGDASRTRTSRKTPTALAAATDRLLRQGALAVKPHVLETLGRATHVVFDKTGTLTYGHPVLRQTSESSSLVEDAVAQKRRGDARPRAVERNQDHPRPRSRLVLLVFVLRNA